MRNLLCLAIDFCAYTASAAVVLTALYLLAQLEF